MRAIGDIRDVKADNASKLITVRGTPSQIPLADWLFAKLDQPAVQGSGAHEYTMTGAEPLHAVGLLFIKKAADTREFQELATLVRSITEFRHFFTYNASKALVFRGTPEQMAAARWLVAELDQPRAPGPRTDRLEFLMKGERENIIRIFYLHEATGYADLLETATVVRALAEIR